MWRMYTLYHGKDVIHMIYFLCSIMASAQSNDRSLMYKILPHTHITAIGYASRSAYSISECSLWCAQTAYCAAVQYSTAVSHDYTCELFDATQAQSAEFVYNSDWEYQYDSSLLHYPQVSLSLFTRTETSSGNQSPGQSPCVTSRYGGGGGHSFSVMTSASGDRVSAIRFCSTYNGYRYGYVTGMDVFLSNGTNTTGIGCYARLDAFPLLELDEGEEVRRVDVYYRYVVQALTVYTTTDVYGVYGVTTDARLVSVYGTRLTGVFGRAANALDSIGFVFEFC